MGLGRAYCEDDAFVEAEHSSVRIQLSKGYIQYIQYSIDCEIAV